MSDMLTYITHNVTKCKLYEKENYDTIHFFDTELDIVTEASWMAEDWRPTTLTAI